MAGRGCTLTIPVNYRSEELVAAVQSHSFSMIFAGAMTRHNADRGATIALAISGGPMPVTTRDGFRIGSAIGRSSTRRVTPQLSAAVQGLLEVGASRRRREAELKVLGQGVSQLGDRFFANVPWPEKPRQSIRPPMPEEATPRYAIPTSPWQGRPTAAWRRRR
jgi:hypothetical protein